jgi:hypothetical protein
VIGNFLSSFLLDGIYMGVWNLEKDLHLLQNYCVNAKFVVKEFELFVLNDFGVSCV